MGRKESWLSILQRAWKEHWGIVLITVLAALFRFAFFDLTRYHSDYAYPGYQALQVLEEGRLFAIGRESTYFLDNPPLMIYIQSLPLLFVRSPLSIQFFMILLNLLVVPLTYLLALRLFEKKTAIAASFVSAISPWAVYFSRAAWEPALVPFFASLVAYLLLPALLEKKNQDRRIFFGLAVTAIMTQTYTLAYAIIAQGGLALLSFRHRVRWQPIMAGLVFFIIVSLPYIYSVLSQWEDSLRDASYLFPGTLSLDADALGHAFRLVTGADYPMDPTNLSPEPWQNNLFQAKTVGLSLLLFLGIVQGVLQIMRRGPADSYLLLLVWFFTPIALMTVHTVGVVLYYLSFTYPAGFIFLGLGARPFLGSRLRIPTLLLALGIVPLFGWRIALTYEQLAQHPDSGHIEFLPSPFSTIKGMNALPLRYSLPIGQMVREMAREVYIKAHREWISVISGTIIKNYSEFEEDNFLVLRANRPALYILLDPHELSPGFAFAQELREREIQLPNDGSIRFFLFPQRSTQELASLPSYPVDLQLNIGWRLLGYNLPDSAHSEDTVAFTTYWLIEELPPNRHSLFLKPFVHLQNAEGKTVAQNDGHGQAGFLWRRGDLYVDTSYIPLPADLPPGEYWIYTGLYNPNTSTRALFPTGEDHILVGPVRIQ